MYSVKVIREQMVEWSGFAKDRDDAIEAAMDAARRGTEKAKRDGSSWDLIGLRFHRAVERMAPKNLGNGGSG